MHDGASGLGVTASYNVVFVGGAARSGTTFLQALITTSKQTNPFTPEFHYLYYLVSSLAQGLSDFRTQGAFFQSPEALIGMHTSFIVRALDEAWETLGCPATLVVKQPNLTPLFGILAKRIPRSRFVVVIRDARDVIASLHRGDCRQAGREAPIAQDTLDQYIDRYNAFYQAILSRADNDLYGKLLALRYEDVAEGDIDKLKEFLDLEDIQPDKLWESEVFDIRNYEGYYLNSSLWGKPMSASNCNTYGSTISEDVASYISTRTWETALAFSALIDRTAAERGPIASEACRRRS